MKHIREECDPTNEALTLENQDISSEETMNLVRGLIKKSLDTNSMHNQDGVPDTASPTMSLYLEKNNITGNVTEIPLFQVGGITREPTEISQILATEKLNGCTAIAIWTQDSAQLSHFPPFMLEKHLHAISTRLTLEDKGTTKQYAFVYLASKRRENESKIIAYLKENLGKDSHITIKYYEQKSDQDSQYVALEFKSNNTTTVYHGKTMTQFTP